MNAGEVLLVARDWLDDAVGVEDLYADPQLMRYLDEAQVEAVLRTRRVVDSTTPEVCTITLVAGQRSYSLHEAVVVAQRVQYRPAEASQRFEVLDRKTTDWLDAYDRHWQNLTGRPHYCVQDIEQRTLTLNREPTASTLGTLALTVWRRPLDAERLLSPGRSPIIPLDDRMKLAHWVCYRAFSHKDSELNDPSRAADHLAQFSAHFGPRPSAAQIRALATDDAGESQAYFY